MNDVPVQCAALAECTTLAWHGSPRPSPNSLFLGDGNMDFAKVERMLLNSTWHGLDFSDALLCEEDVFAIVSDDAAYYFIPAYILHALNLVAESARIKTIICDTACTSVITYLLNKMQEVLLRANVEQIWCIIDFLVFVHCFAEFFGENDRMVNIRHAVCLCMEVI